MITIEEIKRGHISRIESARFINTIRDIERTMICFYTQEEITELTKSKRFEIQERIKRFSNGKMVDYTRSNLTGVFEVRSIFESLLIVDQKPISLGFYKTAEKAYEAYLKGYQPRKYETEIEPESREVEFLNECRNNSLANNPIFNI